MNSRNRLLQDQQFTAQQVQSAKVLSQIEYFNNIDSQPKPFEAATGFSVLDKHLGGGLHPWLYVLGAIPALGKTSLALQIADQIATTGQDVCFFSLEMSHRELIAKSLSRCQYLSALANKSLPHPKTAV